MIVCVPYCFKDIALQRTNLEWMALLGKQDATCLLSTEEGAEDLTELASKVFKEVQIFRYPAYEGNPEWPHPQNYSWQQTARHMYSNGRQPWLWLESDACPLSADWTTKIKEGYEAGGKPFAGCVVHYNPSYMAGCGIYPWNTLEYCPEAMRCRSQPFDMVISQTVMEQTYDMGHLIDHRRAVAQTFLEVEDLKMIRYGAVIFHKAKDGGLQRVLAERQSPTKTASRPVVTTKRSMEPATFYHSGNLGDIIYALYAIQKHGGGDLIIGPDQKDSEPCSNPVNEAQFKLLKPLLDAQPYLSSVKFSAKRPNDALDLNCFRNYWLTTTIRERSKADSLCKMHFYLLSILDRYKDNEMWLTVPEPIKSDRIIVSRSWRHRNWDFDWGGVLKRFGHKLLFIGLPKEHDVFNIAWGHIHKIEYRHCNDFMEMARLIAGASGFIGNQSFSMAMAIGCGQKMLQEVYPKAPDCIFKRKNITTELSKFKP